MKEEWHGRVLELWLSMYHNVFIYIYNHIFNFYTLSYIQIKYVFVCMYIYIYIHVYCILCVFCLQGGAKDLRIGFPNHMIVYIHMSSLSEPDNYV